MVAHVILTFKILTRAPALAFNAYRHLVCDDILSSSTLADRIGGGAATFLDGALEAPNLCVTYIVRLEGTDNRRALPFTAQSGMPFVTPSPWACKTPTKVVKTARIDDTTTFILVDNKCYYRVVSLQGLARLPSNDKDVREGMQNKRRRERPRGYGKTIYETEPWYIKPSPLSIHIPILPLSSLSRTLP